MSSVPASEPTRWRRGWPSAHRSAPPSATGSTLGDGAAKRRCLWHVVWSASRAGCSGTTSTQTSITRASTSITGRRPHGGHLPREGWRNQWALHVAGALPRRRAHLGARRPPTSHDPPSDTRCHACTGQLASPADGGITRSWPHQRGGSPTGPQGPDHRSRPRTADDLSRPATTRQGGDASP